MAKILFIEDEPTLQKTISDALEQGGHTMVQALDGEAGVRLAKTEAPELILLDLILPKKDGFVVLEELKKDPATAAIPVIVLTNLEDSQAVERVLAAGATTYLVKTNYTLDEVLQKVTDTLIKK